MVIGRFYFKLTANGNLHGEFSNQYSTLCYPEAAWRVRAEGAAWPDERTTFPFVGLFHAVWSEGRGEFREAHLTIERRNGAGEIFAVVWRNVEPGGDPAAQGREIFTGDAMRCDDMLVGNYRSVP